MPRKRVLFAASEVYPFAKSGGLADVAHSLPRAIGGGFEATVVLPLYRFVDRARFAIAPLGEAFEITMDATAYRVELYGCVHESLRYIFVETPLLCDRDYLYGPPESGYEDNGLRFGLFCRVIVELLRGGDYALAHLNDWQCALVPLLLKEEGIGVPTLYTIHNLAYQGLFEEEILETLEIPESYFTMEGIEFYNKVNFMKAGIAYADRVTTVSPNYAREILTPEFGCGLEGFLQRHRRKLSGIVNGIDAEHFSPATDSLLIKPFCDLKGKAANKSAYLEEVGLEGGDKPLFVFIGRFTWQKGMELLAETLPKIAALECNVAILGEGEAAYRDTLERVAASHKNVHLEFGYDEGLSHRMYAAADFLLMPSLFEPCGLNQMIAMAYGALPVVHNVGGLADTVQRCDTFDAKSRGGYGILFKAPTSRAFAAAAHRAAELYNDGTLFGKIAAHNMGCDFSWEGRAGAYEALYGELCR